jgi:hypothetical protein
MINELENKDEFKRKYGFLPKSGVLEAKDPEIEHLMQVLVSDQKLNQKHSRKDKFVPERFIAVKWSHPEHVRRSEEPLQGPFQEVLLSDQCSEPGETWLDRQGLFPCSGVSRSEG